MEGSSVKTKLGDGFCSNRWPSSPLGLRLSNNSMKHWRWTLREDTLYTSPHRPEESPRTPKEKDKRERGFLWVCCSKMKNHGNLSPFKAMEKFMLLPETSFKSSMTSLKIAFLWFSEKLCVRAEAVYFDNPPKHQRSTCHILGGYLCDCWANTASPPLELCAERACTVILSGGGRIA